MAAEIEGRHGGRGQSSDVLLEHLDRPGQGEDGAVVGPVGVDIEEAGAAGASEGSQDVWPSPFTDVHDAFEHGRTQTALAASGRDAVPKQRRTQYR
jgi:hypothetical protein